MNNDILKIVRDSNETIQKRKLSGFAWVYLYAGAIVAAAILFYNLYLVRDNFLYAAIPVPIALGAILGFLVGRSRRKKASDAIADLKILMETGDADGFENRLRKTRGGRIWRAYVFTRLYSHLIPECAKDLELSRHAKRIAQALQTESARVDPKSQTLRSIQLFYLDQIMNVFDGSHFFFAPDANYPYPKKEEAFFKSFVDFFGVERDHIVYYLQSIEKKIVRQALSFIDEGNLPAYKAFIEEREGVWSSQPEMLRSILLSVLSSMMQGTVCDFETDSVGREMIDWTVGKFSRVSSEGGGKLPEGELAKLCDRLGSGTVTNENLAASIVRNFGLTAAESEQKALSVMRLLELRRVEQGVMTPVKPSIPNLPAGEECYVETPVTIYRKASESRFDTAAGLDEIVFKEKQKGTLLVMSKSLLISLRSLHVVRYEDVASIRQYASHNIIEFGLTGELGELALSTPENDRVMAYVSRLSGK
jgi:hypothetical protein